MPGRYVAHSAIRQSRSKLAPGPTRDTIPRLFVTISIGRQLETHVQTTFWIPQTFWQDNYSVYLNQSLSYLLLHSAREMCSVNSRQLDEQAELRKVCTNDDMTNIISFMNWRFGRFYWCCSFILIVSCKLLRVTHDLF